MPLNAASSTHPKYDAMTLLWEKYRLTYEGGEDFITKYLKHLSVRESTEDFNQRKEVTYCPAHAKAAINDIKNAIFQRTVDVKRIGGPLNFLNAADGTDAAGVDLQGNTMNSFVGRLLLPELLTMAKVGVWLDKPNVPTVTRADQMTVRPYMYMYRTEDIRNWAFDNNRLVSLILQDHTYQYDQYGLPTEEVTRYRFSWINEEGKVNVQFFDTNNNPISKDGEPDEIVYELALSEIPFIVFEITTSLLTDAADYQIALLNLASSDMSYSLKANFPFYTEQYNPNTELTHLLRGGQTLEQTAPGTAADASMAKTNEARVGVGQGRRYPVGTERPDFINPSPEPLRVSMEKQSQLEKEIRRIINLNTANIDPQRASAESKSYDEHGLESGLSYIALELEYGERKLAQLWAQYEGSKEITRIKYPERYSIKTDDQRNKEAEGLEKSANMNPSLTFKKAALKEAIMIRIAHKVDAETLQTMLEEVDSAKAIIPDAESFFLDLENGLVSPELASQIRGYPEGEVDKAAKAHAERLTRIAIAQSEGAAAKAKAGARGLKDLETDSKEGQEEREEANDTDEDDTVTDKTRGNGRFKEGQE